MANETVHRPLRTTAPSPWVARFATLVPAGGAVLDLAAGGGRHAKLFGERGHPVTTVDKDIAPLAGLGAELIEADLEDGSPWPLGLRRFAGVVVVNYLHRPLLPRIIDAVAPGGVLIYETFARGNEEFAKPRNPDHLLKAGELLDAARGRLQVVAYEHGLKSETPLPGVVQRLCAVNDLWRGGRSDGEPPPHPLHPERRPPA